MTEPTLSVEAQEMRERAARAIGDFEKPATGGYVRMTSAGQGVCRDRAAVALDAALPGWRDASSREWGVELAGYGAWNHREDEIGARHRWALQPGSTLHTRSVVRSNWEVAE